MQITIGTNFNKIMAKHAFKSERKNTDTSNIESKTPQQTNQSESKPVRMIGYWPNGCPRVVIDPLYTSPHKASLKSREKTNVQESTGKTETQKNSIPSEKKATQIVGYWQNERPRIIADASLSEEERKK